MSGGAQFDEARYETAIQKGDMASVLIWKVCARLKGLKDGKNRNENVMTENKAI